MSPHPENPLAQMVNNAKTTHPALQSPILIDVPLLKKKKKAFLAICKPRREAAGKPDLPDTLILHLQPPELRGNQCMSLVLKKKPSVVSRERACLQPGFL